MAEMHCTITCSKRDSGDGVNYSIIQPNSHRPENCDHAWKANNGTTLGTGTSLIGDSCESGIQHSIRCFDPDSLASCTFHDFNSITSNPDAAKAYESINTAVAPDHSQSPTLLYILIPALLVMVVVGVIGFLCYKKRKQPNGVNPDDVETNGHVSSDGGEVVVPLREDP